MNSQTTKSSLVLALFLAAATGCEDTTPRDETTPTVPPAASDRSTTDQPVTSPRDTTRPTTPPPAPSTPPAADPSTVPGSGSPTTTPPSPSSADRDRAISEEIRAIIRQDSTMSAAAEEIEVTTRSGVVTLEGRVMSQAEKDTIEASAKRVSGVLSVVNNLDVEP